MRRRLSDQALILKAVSEVRRELQLAATAESTTSEVNDILLRLISLYTLLDVEAICQVVAASDTRAEYKNKEAV